jgi:hypothetical protein
MARKHLNPQGMESRQCIQDPGFFDDPHAVWAAMMFLSIDGRAAFAVESVQRYAGLTQKKKKVSCLSRHCHPDPLYLN